MDIEGVKLSKGLCRRLAQDAVKIAVLKAPKRTGKGVRGLYAIVEDGTFGIGIRKYAYYMEYQNDGIQPFTMWNLEGKTVPIRLKDGRVIFRIARGVGKPGRINKRDPKTGQIMPGNVGVRWRHPGLKPKNFIEDAIEEAVRLHEAEIVNEALRAVM